MAMSFVAKCLVKRAGRYQPSEVSSFYRDDSGMPMESWEETFGFSDEPRTPRSKRPIAPLVTLLETSVARRWLSVQLVRPPLSAMTDRGAPPAKDDTQRVPTADRIEALRLIKASYDEVNAKLVLFIHPMMDGKYHNDPVLRSFADEHDLLLVDGLALQRGLSRQRFYQGDGVHPTALGHQTYGAAFATLLSAPIGTAAESE